MELGNLRSVLDDYTLIIVSSHKYYTDRDNVNHGYVQYNFSKKFFY